MPIGGTADVGQPLLAREQLIGDLAANRADAAVQRELADEQAAIEPVDGNLPGEREDRHGDRQVEADPVLRMSPGARLTVSAQRGTSNPLDRNAHRMRLRASMTAASAMPTMVRLGMVPEAETSTVTPKASTPLRHAAWTANVAHRALTDLPPSRTRRTGGRISPTLTVSKDTAMTSNRIEGHG